MITVKKITNMDMLAERIAKPKGAVPKFGLPKWKVMSLEQKIPFIPAPKNTYNFNRGKMGRKLWVTGPKMKFDLSDPYCREINFPYESLHDEHLLKFFFKPNNIELLLKAGLITDEKDVKCSLRDYNGYRSYLRKIHADDITRELRRENRLVIEKRALSYAENRASKEARRLQEKERLDNDRQDIVRQRLLQEQLKIQEQANKALKTAQRLKLLKLVKQEERRLMNAKRKERTEKIQQKCKVAAKLARRKMIDFLIDMTRKERARMKARERRLMDNKQHKQKIVEERWKRKLDFQERDIVKQKILSERINNRCRQFIESYNDKINKETTKMQRKLDNAKLFRNCYTKRLLLGGRERVCCEKYFRSNTNENEDEIKKDLMHHSSKLATGEGRKVIASDECQNNKKESKLIYAENKSHRKKLPQQTASA